MQNPSPADSSHLNLPNLDDLAREAGFVTRQSSRLTPSTFLQTLSSAVVTGLASLNQIAIGLSRRAERTITSQAVHQRFGVESTAFLTRVLHQLFAERFREPATAGDFGPVRRILVEDSSVQAMPKANAAAFPAHGNRHGSTAGVKIDFAYDLLEGESVSHTLHAATEQDKTIGKELVSQVREGDLVLRDMGYFSVPEFVDIECLGAFWLTRVPLNLGVVVVELGAGLESVLRRHKGQSIDLEVKAGAEGKPCRLVALRATGRVARQRRKQRREEAAGKGVAPDRDGLIRDGWHLMLTNLGMADFPPKRLRAIYAARWGVEIQFRAWKQSQNLDKALKRKSGEHHLMAIVLAAMINHLIGMRMARWLRRKNGALDLSYEKLYDALAIHSHTAGYWEDILGFAPCPKHIQRDKRKRQSPLHISALGLT